MVARSNQAMMRAGNLVAPGAELPNAELAQAHHGPGCSRGVPLSPKRKPVVCLASVRVLYSAAG